MEQFIDAEIQRIRDTMLVSARETTISIPIQSILLKLIAELKDFKSTIQKTSETQKNSSKMEKLVLDILGVPIIKKTERKKKGSLCIAKFFGDYFGFKRVVEHRNNCDIILPDVDGVYAIHQPYGTQANPDILLIDVRDKNIVCQFGIEVKSGDNLVWNTHIQFADRSMLYIAFKKNVHFFFGDHIRSKESMIYALVWDEIQRRLADTINKKAKKNGLKNTCVAYPKQEFCGLNLDDNREERHLDIKEWLLSFSKPSVSQTETEPHSQSA